jgi:carbamate kinase
MAPKVQAGIDFVRGDGGSCVICAPENLRAALQGDSGTLIFRPGDAGSNVE